MAEPENPINLKNPENKTLDGYSLKEKLAIFIEMGLVGWPAIEVAPSIIGSIKLPYGDESIISADIQGKQIPETLIKNLPTSFGLLCHKDGFSDILYEFPSDESYEEDSKYVDQLKRPVIKGGAFQGLKETLADYADEQELEEIKEKISGRSEPITLRFKMNDCTFSIMLHFDPDKDLYSLGPISSGSHHDKPLDEHLKTYLKIHQTIWGYLSSIQEGLAYTQRPGVAEETIAELERIVEECNKIVSLEKLNRYLNGKRSAQQIEASEEHPYKQLYLILEQRRREIFKTYSEPPFAGVPFPFEDMVHYDFSCQPYLNPDASNEITAGFAQVLKEAGIQLNERVARIHYVDIRTYQDAQGNNRREILSANPARAERSKNIDTPVDVGSTHNDIRSAMAERAAEGAQYPFDIPDVFSENADVRGIVLETLSGQSYGIFSHLKGRRSYGVGEFITSGYGANSLNQIKGTLAVIDQTAAEDIERRYKINLVINEKATAFLEKEVFNRMINQGLTLMFQEQLGRLPTSTELIRARLEAQTGTLDTNLRKEAKQEDL